MIYLKLLLSFLKIGLFSFGGGYAMIPLIQKEIEVNGWLTPSQFVDIIAIAEMTPGPIAVNSATYVGYKSAGIFGGAVATFGVALPSLVLILIVSRLFIKFKDHPLNVMIFYGIRPVIVGLIFASAFIVAKTTLLKSTLIGFKEIILNPFGIIDIKSIVILILTLIALKKLKLHPILVIIGAGIIGVVLYLV